MWFYIDLCDILFTKAKEHIRRAEDISLFPLPPHLSPASSYISRVLVEMVREILKFDEYKAAGGNGSYDIPKRVI